MTKYEKGILAGSAKQSAFVPKKQLKEEDQQGACVISRKSIYEGKLPVWVLYKQFVERLTIVHKVLQCQSGDPMRKGY